MQFVIDSTWTIRMDAAGNYVVVKHGVDLATFPTSSKALQHIADQTRGKQ